jgi:DNA-binding CsgD family transcriptional regulator
MSVSPLVANSLTTIHSDDPNQIRREVVEFIEGQVSCEAALFLKVVEDDDGERYFTAASVMGQDREFREDWITPALESKALQTPWMDPSGDSGKFNRFIRQQVAYPKEFLEDFEINKKFSIPAEVGDQMRMVLREGNRILGWVGCMRRGLGERFRKTEEKRLQSSLQQVRSALRTAENLEAELLHEAHFGVFDEQGKLEYASQAFERFSTKSLRDVLGQRIRRLAGRKGHCDTAIAHGAEIEIVRLDGPTGVRYMVTLCQVGVLRVDPAAGLTGRQREIAEYAAHGATAKEIAATLEISPHTVKTHIKNIYERLQISSRVELAQAILS